jgi:hypothetical protein
MNIEELVDTILVGRSNKTSNVDQELKELLTKIFPEKSDEYKQILYVLSCPKFRFWITEFDYNSRSQKIIWKSVTHMFKGFYELDFKIFYDRGYDGWCTKHTIEKRNNKLPYCYWPIIDKLIYTCADNSRQLNFVYSDITTYLRYASLHNEKAQKEGVMLRKIIVACLDLSLNNLKCGEEYFKIN